MSCRLALKIDVDTDRGTRLGVPNLVADCGEFGAPACFLFSLGPDNTGKAIRRVFRPGFFSKVSRTSIVQLYGIRTLLNGTLLPAPHVGRRNEETMRSVRAAGFEVGIHCHDHIRWQDHLHDMNLDEVREEFARARAEFRRIFGGEAHTAGAAGWQSSAFSRAVYDESGLLYASDTRGETPFFPRIGAKIFTTLEIPTTLPTLDERFHAARRDRRHGAPGDFPAVASVVSRSRRRICADGGRRPRVPRPARFDSGLRPRSRQR
jgi:hypothetical protein